MSSKIPLPSVARAVAFNTKSTLVLPMYVIDHYPDLGSDDPEVVAAEVMRVQGLLGLEADGCLGRGTYERLLASVMPINSEYVVYNGARLALPVNGRYKLISFDEPNGLDLHKYGNFSKRKSAPVSICMHWGGLNARHCFDVFASAERKVSSHFVIGKTGENEATVYQILDLNHCAWHGGTVNDFSIGIDICQSPEVQWKDRYAKAGSNYDVSVVDNPTSRGPAKVLSLDPVLALAVSEFVSDLEAALGFDGSEPPTHDVYSLDELKQFSHFGHHHVIQKKYDIACWWSDVFGRNS